MRIRSSKNAPQQRALRSDCPINFTLQVVGDAWSLLIIRDIALFGKKTFGEFLASDEGIARNILANRLEQLVAQNILVKKKHNLDGRKMCYELTDAGLNLLPLLLDMTIWGTDQHQTNNSPMAWIKAIRTQREKVLALTRDAVKAGDSVFKVIS